MTFEELKLNNPIRKALEELEYEYLTPVQEKAFPIIMSGRDAVGIAQTGTGKTLAYLLPLLQKLTYSDAKDPRILIVVPTRELVIQVTEETKKLAKHSNFRIAGVYGGTNINTQKQMVDKGLDVLIATPGRLIDLALTGILRLRSIQKFVIDEVDEMLNLGFRAQLTNLMDMLPVKRQNLMFSATLTKTVEDIFVDFFNNPHKIEIAPHGTPIERIKQQAYTVPNYHTKINLLEWLLKSDPEFNKVLTFVNSKKTADKLFEAVDKLFPNVIGVIHSNKSQNFRINALKQFQEGTFRMLIATDIIARGLDITDVTHVINFEIPDVASDYIHRIGRTGRADKDGIAITFVNEKSPDQLGEIEQLMKRPVSIDPLPENVVVSKILTEEENPNLFDKNYLKKTSKIDHQAAFQEKKGKNQKVNLGGPKKRNPKFGKPAARPKIAGQVKMTKKSRKTRF